MNRFRRHLTLFAATGLVATLAARGRAHEGAGYFTYDAWVNRAVAVNSRAILEALTAVYGADRLVSETAGSRRKNVGR